MADDDARLLMGAGLAELLEAAPAGGQIHLLALQVRTVPDDGTERADWVARHTGNPTNPTSRRRLHAPARPHPAGRRRPHRGVPHRRRATRTPSAATPDAPAAASLGRARVLYHLSPRSKPACSAPSAAPSVTWLDTADLAVAIRTGFEPGDAPALGDAATCAPHATTQIRPPASRSPPPARPPPTTTLRGYRHGDWHSVAATILLPRKGARDGRPGPGPGALDHRRTPRPDRLLPAPGPHPGRPTAPAAPRCRRRWRRDAPQGRPRRTRQGPPRHPAASTRPTRSSNAAAPWSRSPPPLSVTVPADWDTHDYARRLDASVRLCGFTPLPLDGAHDAAFAAATIPLGIGLPRRRGR